MRKRKSTLKRASCRNRARRDTRFEGKRDTRFESKCLPGIPLRAVRKERALLMRASALLGCLSTELKYTKRRDKHYLIDLADRARRLLSESLGKLECRPECRLE